ncbi:JmjC domain-containing protein 1 [Grifola frondosa]|uniref:JmjC domain-containing protein 1 n=1 Tax=Grifola frondosa TaxID=5627 RepID=A0A1C7MKU4_GRIFR|nr:JmjC domain-containing protein 1 [Grifola frondosa]
MACPRTLVRHSSNSEAKDACEINWTYLKTAYGSCEVAVADCATRNFSDQKRETMPFAKTGTSPIEAYRPAECTNPRLRSFYTTPDIFRDDWMNAYYSACTEDDFRFVYVGAAGTFTRSIGTSTPHQTPYLLRKGYEEHLETAFDVREVDSEAFPQFEKARPIVVEQKAGESIFIPSGWYHQVENLTDCISINHNWCNAANLPSLYSSMCAKVIEVEHALEDVRELLSHNQEVTGKDGNIDDANGGWEREWTHIVQDLVEKDAGWNWMTFWRMVRHAMQAATQTKVEVSDDYVYCKYFGDDPAATELEQTRAVEIMGARTSTPDAFSSFVNDHVKACYDDFVLRDRRELALVPGLDAVLREVGQLLEAAGNYPDAIPALDESMRIVVDPLWSLIKFVTSTCKPLDAGVVLEITSNAKMSRLRWFSSTNSAVIDGSPSPFDQRYPGEAYLEDQLTPTTRVHTSASLCLSDTLNYSAPDIPAPTPTSAAKYIYTRSNNPPMSAVSSSANTARPVTQSITRRSGTRAHGA